MQAVSLGCLVSRWWQGTSNAAMSQLHACVSARFCQPLERASTCMQRKRALQSRG